MSAMRASLEQETSEKVMGRSCESMPVLPRPAKGCGAPLVRDLWRAVSVPWLKPSMRFTHLLLELVRGGEGWSQPGCLR